MRRQREPFDAYGLGMRSFRNDDFSPPPPTLWQGRLQSAEALIKSNVSDPGILRRVDDIQAALWTADQDRKRMEQTLQQIQPERAARELKDALRDQFEDPSNAVDDLVASLQRRHETIHSLQDRIESIESSIDRTVADVEQLAASSAQLALGSSASGHAELMEHLNEDLEILAKVHRELADQ